MEEIKPTDLVLTLPITYHRNIYEKLTLVSDLPADLQKIAKTRKLIAKYSDVVIQEKNPDYKKKYDKLQTENVRLKNENVTLRKNVKHYEELLKDKKVEKK